MSFAIDVDSSIYGFVHDGLGAHSSRTLMLHELTLLLDARPAAAQFASYAAAIMDDNVLLKADGCHTARVGPSAARAL